MEVEVKVEVEGLETMVFDDEPFELLDFCLEDGEDNDVSFE